MTLFIAVLLERMQRRHLRSHAEANLSRSGADSAAMPLQGIFAKWLGMAAFLAMTIS
jgi:hypothetical protein